MYVCIFNKTSINVRELSHLDRIIRFFSLSFLDEIWRCRLTKTMRCFEYPRKIYCCLLAGTYCDSALCEMVQSNIRCRYTASLCGQFFLQNFISINSFKNITFLIFKSLLITKWFSPYLCIYVCTYIHSSDYGQMHLITIIVNIRKQCDQKYNFYKNKVCERQLVTNTYWVISPCAILYILYIKQHGSRSYFTEPKFYFG